jgi:ribosomal-protein-alanine N-acetyltransferase
VSTDLPELRSARMILRIGQSHMAGAMARFFAENWSGHLERWSPRVGPGYFTESFWIDRLERAELEWRARAAARFVLHSLDDPDGPILGTCNYSNIVRGPFCACNLGYQIARSHEGRGLMAEAVARLNAFAFEEIGMHRIMANYIPENHRSGQLLERLGFVREGIARNYLFIDGAWRDHVLTALTNERFDTASIETPG